MALWCAKAEGRNRVVILKPEGFIQHRTSTHLSLAPNPRRVLTLRSQLLHHLPHCGVGTGSAFFPPRFEALANIFQIAKNRRILERRAPCRNDVSNAVPDYPDLAVAFEEKLIVDETPVHDARHHFPIADDHADVRI